MSQFKYTQVLGHSSPDHKTQCKDDNLDVVRFAYSDHSTYYASFHKVINATIKETVLYNDDMSKFKVITISAMDSKGNTVELALYTDQIDLGLTEVK